MELQLKLYDFKGTFKKQINPKDLFSNIGFQEELDGGQGNLTLSLNGILSDYNTSDIIEIRSSDKGNLYTGIIEDIDVVEYENTNTLHITLYGVFTVLNDLIFKNGGTKTFTLTNTVGNLIKLVVDSFNLDYGVLVGDTQIIGTQLIRYTTSSIDITGGTVSIDFANETCISAMKKIVKNTNFNFTIGADGVVNLIQKNNQINNILTFEKEILSITRKISKRKMTNKYYLVRNGGVELSYEDIIEQGLSGLKEKYTNDTSILDIATQNIKGNEYINANKLNDNIVVITIKNILPHKIPLSTFTNLLSSYTQPLNSFIPQILKPGQTITTLNSVNNLINKEITKINIQPTYTEISLGDFISFGKEIMKLTGKVL